MTQGRCISLVSDIILVRERRIRRGRERVDRSVRGEGIGDKGRTDLCCPFYLSDQISIMERVPSTRWEKVDWRTGSPPNGTKKSGGEPLPLAEGGVVEGITFLKVEENAVEDSLI